MAGEGRDEERVLGVVQSRSEGIGLVDIGNELGLDWRALISPSRALVDQGKIEKIEGVYYPKETGPDGERGLA